ncbi:hypothetical protein [Paenibacillus montanisoli]|uniref:Uncharacterized protein n=1 Tax=Paenibacillus montanisoli TaxID=2081970 RepID=A0A328U3P3_9BACL|nr:hypothetical protein [Paenibacillus montanisoli]RAP77230.1 hypothetical protein DL346_01640 [Paenibacillus montanisoli]
MKRKIIVIILVITVILFLTNPGDSKYESWLENNHGVSCTNDGIDIKCKQVKETEEIIEWRSRHVKHLGIYSIYDDYYENKKGEEIIIRAVGILNTFFNR